VWLSPRFPTSMPRGDEALLMVVPRAMALQSQAAALKAPISNLPGGSMAVSKVHTFRKKNEVTILQNEDEHSCNDWTPKRAPTRARPVPATFGIHSRRAHGNQGRQLVQPRALPALEDNASRVNPVVQSVTDQPKVDLSFELGFTHVTRVLEERPSSRK
jgi:hypothetical protein